ncbi:hypothetical protein CROQUDRAFT_683001 [Cronartium quercuum f. sp. fusiforme G11]|uniref:Uncharacterized protein n=1 Tax=Cronartium quercuum f. sp. fusiforme G11 TaxID=708437 RepID=A0A9P6N9N0_9BASI|nr:hypothetical protein CROQUDRAFT_683001 [Cronartium quercuum f. sp. fusiforme G11]
MNKAHSSNPKPCEILSSHEAIKSNFQHHTSRIIGTDMDLNAQDELQRMMAIGNTISSIPQHITRAKRPPENTSVNPGFPNISETNQKSWVSYCGFQNDLWLPPRKRRFQNFVGESFWTSSPPKYVKTADKIDVLSHRNQELPGAGGMCKDPSIRVDGSSSESSTLSTPDQISKKRPKILADYSHLMAQPSELCADIENETQGIESIQVSGTQIPVHRPPGEQYSQFLSLNSRSQAHMENQNLGSPYSKSLEQPTPTPSCSETSMLQVCQGKKPNVHNDFYLDSEEVGIKLSGDLTPSAVHSSSDTQSTYHSSHSVEDEDEIQNDHGRTEFSEREKDDCHSLIDKHEIMNRAHSSNPKPCEIVSSHEVIRSDVQHHTSGLIGTDLDLNAQNELQRMMAIGNTISSIPQHITRAKRPPVNTFLNPGFPNISETNQKSLVSYCGFQNDLWLPPRKRHFQNLVGESIWTSSPPKYVKTADEIDVLSHRNQELPGAGGMCKDPSIQVDSSSSESSTLSRPDQISKKRPKIWADYSHLIAQPSELCANIEKETQGIESIQVSGTQNPVHRPPGEQNGWFLSPNSCSQAHMENQNLGSLYSQSLEQPNPTPSFPETSMLQVCQGKQPNVHNDCSLDSEEVGINFSGNLTPSAVHLRSDTQSPYCSHISVEDKDESKTYQSQRIYPEYEPNCFHGRSFVTSSRNSLIGHCEDILQEITKWFLGCKQDITKSSLIREYKEASGLIKCLDTALQKAEQDLSVVVLGFLAAYSESRSSTENSREVVLEAWNFFKEFLTPWKNMDPEILIKLYETREYRKKFQFLDAKEFLEYLLSLKPNSHLSIHCLWGFISHWQETQPEPNQMFVDHISFMRFLNILAKQNGSRRKAPNGQSQKLTAAGKNQEAQSQTSNQGLNRRVQRQIKCQGTKIMEKNKWLEKSIKNFYQNLSNLVFMNMYGIQTVGKEGEPKLTKLHLKPNPEKADPNWKLAKHAISTAEDTTTPSFFGVVELFCKQQQLQKIPQKMLKLCWKYLVSIFEQWDSLTFRGTKAEVDTEQIVSFKRKIKAQNMSWTNKIQAFEYMMHFTKAYPFPLDLLSQLLQGWCSHMSSIQSKYDSLVGLDFSWIRMNSIVNGIKTLDKSIGLPYI